MSNTRDLLFVGSRDSEEWGLAQALEPDWSLHGTDRAEEARELLEKHPFRVGLVDLENPDPGLGDLLGMAQPTQWVALVNPPVLEKPKNAQLIYQSCFDYHSRPFDPDRLHITLGHAWGMAHLDPRSLPSGADDEEFQMVGTSPAMHRVFNTIRKVANVDAPVLILGESGTGKELTAQAIHERSSRRDGPFVAVNCGALPPNLVHSELFGHEKGAFTGAHQQRIGRLEAAHKGTIFLDEIGDLPGDLQVNLLRTLQEQKIQRVGSNEDQPLDVRILAATHKDLEAEVEAGTFREDLFYRLNVLNLRMPSLRERQGDIEILARFYFEKFVREQKAEARGFSHQALAAMRQYDWPGNVRELINRIRRALVMCERRLISPADLDLEGPASPSHVLTLAEARAAAEKEAVQNALHQSGNNVSQASRILKVSRPTLYRLMEIHGLEV